MDILKIEPEMEDEDRKAYFGAFQSFDWSNNGNLSFASLMFVMRRVGANPTEVEVQDIINRMDDGTETFTFTDFCKIMLEKNKEVNAENDYKESFRVFSKDENGFVSADELRFVLQNLPGKVSNSSNIMNANRKG